MAARGGLVGVKPKAILSWSSGKDGAWALHQLRQRGEVEVVGLVTTFNEAFHRVAMHGVRMELVQAQARAARLPFTGPWNWLPQQRSLRMYFRIKACPPGSLAGKRISTCDARHLHVLRHQRATD